MSRARSRISDVRFGFGDEEFIFGIVEDVVVPPAGAFALRGDIY